MLSAAKDLTAPPAMTVLAGLTPTYKLAFRQDLPSLEADDASVDPTVHLLGTISSHAHPDD